MREAASGAPETHRGGASEAQPIQASSHICCALEVLPTYQTEEGLWST